MEWQVIVALVVAVPVILFPAAFLWYLNAGGLYQAMRATRQRKARHAEAVAQAVKEAETIAPSKTPVGTAGK